MQPACTGLELGSAITKQYFFHCPRGHEEDLIKSNSPSHPHSSKLVVYRNIFCADFFFKLFLDILLNCLIIWAYTDGKMLIKWSRVCFLPEVNSSQFRPFFVCVSIFVSKVKGRYPLQEEKLKRAVTLKLRQRRDELSIIERLTQKWPGWHFNNTLLG